MSKYSSPICLFLKKKWKTQGNVLVQGSGSRVDTKVGSPWHPSHCYFTLTFFRVNSDPVCSRKIFRETLLASNQFPVSPGTILPSVHLNAWSHWTSSFFFFNIHFCIVPSWTQFLVYLNACWELNGKCPPIFISRTRWKPCLLFLLSVLIESQMCHRHIVGVQQRLIEYNWISW